MRTIQTPGAPTPAGHYSQAVVHAGMVHVAGQLPIVPGSPDRTPGDIGTQTEQALRNVEAILHAAGSSLDRLLSVTIYVTDVAHWPVVNAAYARVMGSARPARAVVPVTSLNHGYAVEIQAVAAAGAD